MKHRLLTALALFLFTSTLAQFQGLIVNEFSQGNTGNREYIELLVVGSRTCTDSLADLRGWIFDDQNGWYGTTNGTQGHYRFKNDPAWASVPFGSIILVYNAADKNTSITLADDPTDANDDYNYIVPIAHGLIEQNSTEPDNNSGAAYSYPPAAATAGYTASTNQWQFLIGLNNTNGDVISTVSPANRSNAFFSIGYGYPATPGYQVPLVSIANVGAGFHAYLSNAVYASPSAWITAAVPAAESPGLPNGGANTTWIQGMRQQAALTQPQVSITQTSCFSATGSIIVNSPNGPGLSFSLDGVNYSNTFGVFSGLAPGTYSVTVKNTLGCVSPVTMVTINPQPVTPAAPVVTITQPDCNIATGTITINTPTGAGFVYSIDGLNYTASTVFTGLSPSLYGVSVKNTVGGCTSPAVIVGVNPPPPSFTVSVTAASLCPGGSATVHATTSTPGSYQYTWTVPAGVTNPGNAASFSTTVPGIYSVSAASNGCTANASDTMQLAFVISAADTTVCENGQVTLTGQPSGGTWSSPYVSGGQFDAAGLSPGNYSVSYQYTSNGCTANATATVTVMALPPAPSITVTDLCNGTSTLTATNYTGALLWNNGATTSSITVTAAGNYLLTQTLNGCTSAAVTGLATPGALPQTPTASVSQQPDCTNPSGIITVTSPASGTGFVYSIDGLNYTNTTGVFTGLTPGNYSVTVRDNLGCTSAPINLVVSAPPAAPPSPTFQLTQPDCTNSTGSITVTSPVGAAYSYSIDGTSFQASTLFSSLLPGSYMVTVQNNGCLSTASAMIQPASGTVYQSTTACIQEGQSYNFNGQQLTSTGHYSATYQQPGGCDSVVQLYLLVKTFDTVQLQGCQQLQYNGTTYTSSTTVTEVLPSAITGCDSIQRTVQIQIGQTLLVQQNVCLNAGQTYIFNGQALSASGIYSATYPLPGGCDSIVQLHLLVKSLDTLYVQGCQQLVYNGTTYTASTMITEIIPSITTSCDSVQRTVYIQVSQPVTNQLNVCLQSGQSYSFNGQNLQSSGIYADTLPAQNGCDSVISLQLTVAQNMVQNLSGCGAVSYNGNVYMSSTTVYDTLPSLVTGCDSVQLQVVIQITPGPQGSVTACIDDGQSYNFNGQVLTSGGNYTTTYPLGGACDSTVSLYLVVTDRDTLQMQGCGSLVYNGTVYQQSAIVRDTVKSLISGCDSLIHVVQISISQSVGSIQNICLPPGQTYSFNGMVLSSSGLFADTLLSALGCDSIIQLNLTITNLQAETYEGCGSVVYNTITYTSDTTLLQIIPAVNGCDSIHRQVQIVVHALPVLQMPAAVTICRGDSITLTASAQGASVQWTGFGAGNSIRVAPDQTTVYQAVASSPQGCSSSGTVTVSLHDFNLQLSASQNPAIAGTQVQLQTSAVDPYQILSWKPAHYFAGQQLKSQQLTADTTTLLVVTGVSDNGCRDTAYLTLQVNPLDDIYIPEAFTPNGDGKNDVFRVLGGNLRKLHLQVFNRWGERIFESRERARGWDGSYAGKPQPGGAYIYLLVAETVSGAQVTRKGTVILIR